MSHSDNVDHVARKGLTHACQFMLGITFSLLLFATARERAEVPDACARNQAALVWVDTASHRLYACEARSVAFSFGVRLGRHGTGKTRAGDGKTPLGAYALGTPRASKQYGTFIPVGYPTAAQLRQGHTGGSIGVHGPLREVRWLGHAVNWFDTSDGCIGLATDEEMASLTDWVRPGGCAASSSRSPREEGPLRLLPAYDL